MFFACMAIYLIFFFGGSQRTLLARLHHIDSLQFQYGGIDPLSGRIIRKGTFFGLPSQDFQDLLIEQRQGQFYWSSWRGQKMIPHYGSIKKDGLRDVIVAWFVSENADGFVLVEYGKIADLHAHWGVRTTYELFCGANPIAPISHYYEYRFTEQGIVWVSGEVDGLYPKKLRNNFCDYNSSYSIYYNETIYEKIRNYLIGL